MNSGKTDKIKIKLYEYPLYWLVTGLVLLLAIPIIIIKFVLYLVRATGAPLKSVKNLIGFVLVIIIVAGLVTAYEIFIPYDIGVQTRSIMIEENDSFAHVMSDLKEKQILKGAYLFKALAVTFDIDKTLAPGRYDFAGKISIYDILNKLKNYEIATVLIAVPEGLTVRKTAGIFAQKLGIDSSDFVDRAFDTLFTREKYKVDNLEGYLFPETYRLWFGIKIDEIIDILYSQFDEKTDDLFDDLPDDSFSRNEIMTLASIIEAEAMAGEERGLISSVYHNRLKKRMLLQADPTVIYAIGGLDRPLWYRDLKYDSPYNTYIYRGLPPGPINSPGLEAIRAAIYPEDSEYLYFVADGTGRHTFSKTLLEHNRAKRKVKNNSR